MSITDKVITITLKSVTFPAGYGDVNKDGVIDVIDSGKLNGLIGASAITKDQITRADMNLDGMVTKEDLMRP